MVSPSTSSASNRLSRAIRRNRGVVAFALVALAVKLLVFEMAVSTDPNAYRTNDSARYTALATELVEHRTFSADGQPEVMRTPGYPLFLASLMTLGVSGHLVVIVQIGLAFVVAAMVWNLVQSRAPPVNNKIAAAGAFGIVVLDPAFTSAQLHLMTETLFVLFLTLGLLFISKYEVGGETKNLWAALVSFTMATFVRSIGLYLVPLLIVLLCVRTVLRRTESWRLRLTHLALALVAYGAIVGAWTMRNHQVSGVATFSSAGATHLYENLAAASVARAKDRSWHEVRSEFRSHSYNITDNEAERAEYAWGQTVNILSEHPKEALFVALQGTITILLDPGTGQFANFMGLRESDTGLTSKYYDLSLSEFVRYMLREERALTALVALGGLWMLFFWGSCAAGGIATFGSDWTFFHVFMILMAIYFIGLAAGPSGMARYRIPALPIFAYYGGIGFAWLWPGARGLWQRQIRNSKA